MPKILIAYYSFSSTTENVALEIAVRSGGELLKIVPEDAYSFAHNTAAKEVRAQIERGYCPKLLAGGQPIDGYDTVFIGTPNWFKSIAPPIRSFLRAHDFSGKRIIPFCTHGGGGFGDIISQIEQECPGAIILSGLALGEAGDVAAIEAWLEQVLPSAN